MYTGLLLVTLLVARNKCNKQKNMVINFIALFFFILFNVHMLFLSSLFYFY